MNKLNDAFYKAKIKVLLTIVQAEQAGKLRIARLHEQATWRLNETEAALLPQYLGYFWQPFYYPYGQRRNAQSLYFDNDGYAEHLPPEHRGLKSQQVATPFSGYDYPVSRYLERVEYIEQVRRNYRVNWLGQYVRK